MTPEQFSNCLAKGLGRTHMYLQEHDAEPYKDAILHGCLYNPVYDSVCEGTRTDYFYELIQLTRDLEWFRGRIVEALRESEEEMDVAQLMEFALRFAQEGDKEARQLLNEKCGEYASLGEPFLADSVIHLDGTEGFLYVANRLGETLLHEPEIECIDYLLRCLQEKTGCADVSELRMAARGRYPFVDVYLDKICTSKDYKEERESKNHLFIELSYEQLRQRIADEEQSILINQYERWISSVQFEKWGENATETDITKAAYDLLHQSNVNQIIRYLSIFTRRTFPLDYELLIPFIWNENGRIACTALEALAQFQHPRIRKLAFHLIETDYRVGDAVELFQKNLVESDEEFFLHLLHRINEPVLYHDLGLGLKAVINANPTPLFKEVLIHLYENNPCSLCRYSFVKRMIENNTLPEYIKREALFDSDEEIRKMVGAMKGGEL